MDPQFIPVEQKSEDQSEDTNSQDKNSKNKRKDGNKKRGNNRKWKDMAFANKFMVIFTGIIAIGTIVTMITMIFYTCYARKQWQAMSGQIRQMESSSNQTWQAIGNMNWLARTTEESLRRLLAPFADCL